MRGILGTAALLAPALAPAPAHAAGGPTPGYEPALPALILPHPADGGIFDPAAGYAALYEGARARAVGDPLTIRLVESTTTAKTVSAKSAKAGNAAIVPPATGILSFAKPSSLSGSSKSAFDGNGQAAQTSTLDATLSVTIAEVRPNGTALVRGERRMLFSQGREWIQFSGIVRLIDIDQDNVVPSGRVADARVEYSGKGALQQASKQGWLGRFFNLISPF